MDRLTKLLDNGIYIANENQIKHNENGYFGNAINKLAKFENIYEDLILKQKEISTEMEKLKLEGKTNSVKFKQLLANKLTNSNIIMIFEKYEQGVKI